MKQLIRMITPFIAMLFLVACSSSDSIVNDIVDDSIVNDIVDDSIVDDIVDDIVDNPITSDPKFTSDILVGKTYTTTDGEIVTRVIFTETEVTVVEDGEIFTLSYSIDEDGVLEVGDDDDFHTLISIDENGDLHVRNEGEDSVWVLTVLEEALIVGETKYYYNSRGGTGYRNYAADGSYTGLVSSVEVSGTYEIVGNVVTLNRTSPNVLTVVLTYIGEEAGGLAFIITVDGGEEFLTVSFATEAERDAYIASL